MKTLEKLSEIEIAEEYAIYNSTIDEENPCPSLPYCNLSVVTSNREEEEECLYESVLEIKKSTVKSGHDYAIQELIETEEKYFEKSLKAIKINFMIPLRGQIQSYDTFFKYIGELLAFHEEFLKNMKMCNENGRGLGELFINNRTKFVIYGEYCSNIPKAEDAFMELSLHHKSLFKECEQKFLEDKRQKFYFSFVELLKVPFQRLLKYPNILSRIHNSMPDSDREKLLIKQAENVMKDVSNYTNEMKRENEMNINLHVIQNDIEFSSTNVQLSEYGRLIKDGYLKVLF